MVLKDCLKVHFKRYLKIAILLKYTEIGGLTNLLLGGQEKIELSAIKTEYIRNMRSIGHKMEDCQQK